MSAPVDRKAEAAFLHNLPIAREALNMYRQMSEREARVRTYPLRYRVDTGTFDPPPPGEWAQKQERASSLFTQALVCYAQNDDAGATLALRTLLDMVMDEGGIKVSGVRS